jgi:amino acid transporter
MFFVLFSYFLFLIIIIFIIFKFIKSFTNFFKWKTVPFCRKWYPFSLQHRTVIYRIKLPHRTGPIYIYYLLTFLFFIFIKIKHRKSIQSWLFNWEVPKNLWPVAKLGHNFSGMGLFPILYVQSLLKMAFIFHCGPLLRRWICK